MLAIWARPGPFLGESLLRTLAKFVLPAAGGILWMVDYRLTFIGGALLAFCSLLAVQRIPRV